MTIDNLMPHKSTPHISKSGRYTCLENGGLQQQFRLSRLQKLLSHILGKKPLTNRETVLEVLLLVDRKINTPKKRKKLKGKNEHNEMFSKKQSTLLDRLGVNPSEYALDTYGDVKNSHPYSKSTLKLLIQQQVNKKEK